MAHDRHCQPLVNKDQGGRRSFYTGSLGHFERLDDPFKCHVILPLYLSGMQRYFF